MASKGLDSWLRKLTKQNMPVVGQVIAELNSITGKEDADLNQLAEVILRDPHLTSHVLRVANSVHYNYSNFPINTVSRAIVLIGLKGMRAVCISLLLIDSLIKKDAQEQLLKLMAQALHAATQARELVKMHDEDAAEEVFIAALLFHLGEMAFIANEKMTEQNEGLFEGSAKDRKQAMEDILGTSFKAITRGLAQHWKLGETLENALYPKKTSNEKVQAVVIGERMSRAAIKGWDSSAVSKVVDEIRDFTGKSREECLTFAQDCAEQATQVALNFGAMKACIYIPGKNHSSETEAQREQRLSAKIMRGDAQLQLSILRELTTAVSEKADVNTIFQMVLEGMHRGVGLERVAIAFIHQHRAKAKYCLGEGTETWRDRFDFDVGPYTDNIFTHAIGAGGATWVDQTFLGEHAHLFCKRIENVIGVYPSFIYVVRVGDRTPALFYTDRGDFGGKLSKDQFESFRHFASQAQLNLNLLSQNMKQKA